jgi:hypothetical protein
MFTSKFDHNSLARACLFRKIKDIKQYTVDEGQKMNESLKAYQTKFEKQLKGLHQDLDDTFKKERKYQADEIRRGYDRIKALDDMCEQERADRIRDLDDALAPLEQQIDVNTADLDEERNQRVTNERTILDNLAADAKKIEDAIL